MGSSVLMIFCNLALQCWEVKFQSKYFCHQIQPYIHMMEREPPMEFGVPPQFSHVLTTCTDKA
jgi:hypothetical protein